MADSTTSPSTSTSDSKRKADDFSSSLLVDSTAAPITSPPPSDIVAGKRRKIDDAFGNARLSSSLDSGPSTVAGTSTGNGSTKVKGSVPAEPEQDDGDDDEEDEEKESTPKPKPRKKKEVKKQLVVWDDIKGWKEGDDPLGRFPAEVLDLIISVDSDLDLRDHLALAGTCRWFRTCYTDAVFQVLCQAKFPYLTKHPVDHLNIHNDGFITHIFDRKVQEGPFARSYNTARHILAAGGESARPIWNHWGMPEAQFAPLEEGLKQDQAKLRSELNVYMTAFLQPGVESIEPEWRGILQSNMKRLIEQSYADHCVSTTEEEHSAYSRHVNSYPGLNPFNQARDPWASDWRKIVVKHVNKPQISRTDAKKEFKVTDAQLLALKVSQDGNKKFYSKAAVEVLAFRAHGGEAGHKKKIADLATRQAKAKATRIANGTYKPPKPKGPPPLVGLPRKALRVADLFEDMFKSMAKEYMLANGLDHFSSEDET